MLCCLPSGEIEEKKGGRDKLKGDEGELFEKTFNHNNKEGTMGEIVHTSRIKIVREKGPTRRAMIEGFNEPIYYGVHGGIKKFYKVEPDKEHAATLDHIVAATAG
jgi:hypothetical protein